jgi:hypothetical protein
MKLHDIAPQLPNDVQTIVNWFGWQYGDEWTVVWVRQDNTIFYARAGQRYPVVNDYVPAYGRDLARARRQPPDAFATHTRDLNHMAPLVIE